MPTRLVVIVVSLLAAIAATAFGVGWRVETMRLDHQLRAATGVDPIALEQITREDVTHHAKLKAARALIGAVLDSERVENGELVVDPATLEHLPRARELALEALEAQPNSWQAAMWLGTANYLEAWHTRDPVLIQDADRWQEPLLTAYANAGGRREAQRLLAVAYLRLWPYLSGDRRAFATRLVRTTFADHPEVFKQLGPLWLTVADRGDEALSAVPDTPEAWRLVTRTWAQQGLWRQVIQAERERVASLERSLHKRIEDADSKRTLGEAYESRSLYLGAVVRAPVDGRFAPLVTRSLENYPPGLHGLSSTGPIGAWLRWALELADLGRTDVLPPRVLTRLAGATDELDPHETAYVSLLAGDLTRAERAERLVETLSTAPWAPYLVAKTHYLLDRDAVESATVALDQVGRYVRGSAGYWQARQRLAEATGDLDGVVEADRALDGIRAEAWSSTAWQRLKTKHVLRMLASRRASGVVIELNDVPAEGTVVNVLVDGSSVDLIAVRPGDRLDVDVVLSQGLHQIELRPVVGAMVDPGRVRLTGQTERALTR
ncbi:MAG: hypothetical protein AAGD38_12110 [Acidobacteriota bacterium]